MKKYLFILLFLTIPSFSQAEVMYIDDTLLVPLRSGEGLQYRIVHKGVKSGTRVELIAHNPDSGYSHVKTPDGITGYLPTRYLVKNEIARDRLVKVSAQLEKSQAKLAQLQTEMNELKQKYDSLSSNHEQLTRQSESTSSELQKVKSISSNALSLDQRNRELRKTNQELKNEVELLTTDNQRLKDKSETSFMMIGAALVLLGVILALIIPWLKPTKKNDSWA
ncbi:TIGR04211 family SH3 domain-containing protein [Alkalimarinus sediminis]|uniref:TIGR04211 family SH3 domain-containing protein n=1 Tax=Alkalimarinus sediminis TaxID=1632866 RepID=A0A9E8KRS7_9ALTE|nr:TIGR04211 family SH3 domain-containing protein [Alkalimarinus sediminis]UZW76492.1 TIGR04211 family SH3 domain-containing protein [Alkalimarinus sediminis]